MVRAVQCRRPAESASGNELIQEKNYLNSILESSEGCIAVVDEDNNIVSANDEAKALLEIT